MDSAVLGNKYVFPALMKLEAPHLQGTQCFLHLHALASKTMSPKLKEVLDISVKSQNWIRGHAVNHRLLSLCEDLGSIHTGYFSTKKSPGSYVREFKAASSNCANELKYFWRNVTLIRLRS